MKTQTFVYDVCRHYVADYSQVLGDDLCNKLNGFIRARDISRLASAGDLFDQASHGREIFAHLRQISAFFKKNAEFVGADCDLTAISSFLQAEKVCRITNKRLDHYFLQRDRLDPDLEMWLSKAERFIRNVLGEFDLFLEDLPSRIRVTSGASATAGRRNSLPHLKLKKRIRCTAPAAPYLDALAKFFGYTHPQYRVSNWNRVETVPKNWKTDRTIACEQEGNIPLQLAFDDYCKERLRKYAKIDLRDQSRNQDLARTASLSGDLATVDLKAASDSLSYNTVLWLLPESWARYLCDIRAPYYRLPDGSYGKYAKFSSMGNGATFALETLIFASACYAVGSKAYSVYGDDIIIESSMYNDLVRLLGFLGFTVNLEKSYSTGPFRESCGADWYQGINVTPFYIREWSHKQETVLAHNINGLAGIAKPEGYLEAFLLQLVRGSSLPLVPFNDVSTSGIWIDVHTAYELRLFTYKSVRGPKRKRGYTGVLRYKRLVVKTPTKTVSDSRSLFLWYLDKYRKRGNNDSVVIRSRVPILSTKYVRKWVCWNPPARLAPVHLYRWTDSLLSAISADSKC